MIINIDLIILHSIDLLYNTAKQLDQHKTYDKNKLKRQRNFGILRSKKIGI